VPGGASLAGVSARRRRGGRRSGIDAEWAAAHGAAGMHQGWLAHGGNCLCV
jgi:hypothetical protein